MGDWLWTLQDVFGFLSGKVHSHHPHKEIEGEDLENTLIENYKVEDQPLDEFEDNNEDLQLEDMDGQLAAPRAYPLPMLWRWLQRVRIGCTIKCARYNWCRVCSRGHCSYPRGCNCRRFAWEKKQ